MCDCSCCTGCTACMCHIKAAISEAIKPLEKMCDFNGYGRGIITAMNAIRNCNSMADAMSKMDALLINWQADYEYLMKEHAETR